MLGYRPHRTIGWWAMAAGPQDQGALPDLEMLAEPTRRLIVCLLAERPPRPTDLRQAIGASQSTLAFHLGALRRAGIVIDSRVARDGRVRLYTLHPRRARAITAWLAASGLGPAGSDVPSTTTPRWPRHVVDVRLGPHRIALVSDGILQTVRDAAVTVLPFGYPSVIGIVEVGGRIVPVVDLASRLGLTQSVVGGPCTLLLVDVPDRTIALRVDAAAETHRLGSSDVETMPTGALGTDVAVLGLVRRADGLTVLVDVVALLD
jgi:purine-binding chemotaxis protein CheW